jgi:hypothetical protein
MRMHTVGRMLFVKFICHLCSRQNCVTSQSLHFIFTHIHKLSTLYKNQANCCFAYTPNFYLLSLHSQYVIY